MRVIFRAEAIIRADRVEVEQHPRLASSGPDETFTDGSDSRGTEKSEFGSRSLMNLSNIVSYLGSSRRRLD